MSENGNRAALNKGEIIKDIVVDPPGKNTISSFLKIWIAGKPGNFGSQCCINLGGQYYFPNYEVDSFSTYTNNPISIPFRGFGVFQAAIIHESQTDQLADKQSILPFSALLWHGSPQSLLPNQVRNYRPDTNPKQNQASNDFHPLAKHLPQFRSGK